MPKFLLFLFLAVISFSVKAQTWEFGAGIGGAGYMGSLNLTNPLKVSGPSASGFAKYNFDGYLSLKTSFTYGVISGADSNSSNAQFRQRNLSFTTPLYESNILGEFNFMNYIPSVTHNKYTPYIFFGFAAVSYFPYTIYNGKKFELRSIKTEGEKKAYPTTAFGFPYGAGFKYNIAGSFTLGAEIGYRNPNTNYLDDVSGYYYYSGHKTVAELLSDRSGEKTGIYTGSPGTQRGDLESRDTYFFTQVTLSFTFISQKCYFHN